MSDDTLELPILPASAVPLSLGAGLRRRLASPNPPLPSWVVPVLMKRPRHARRVTKSRGYRITNAALWWTFAAVVPPMVAAVGGPFIYEVGI